LFHHDVNDLCDESVSVVEEEEGAHPVDSFDKSQTEPHLKECDEAEYEVSRVLNHVFHSYQLLQDGQSLVVFWELCLIKIILRAMPLLKFGFANEIICQHEQRVETCDY
jgi:hypothetical protein